MQRAEMKATNQRQRNRWRATVRIVAVMFLLLAGADLAFPEICSEGHEPLLEGQTASTVRLTLGDDSGEPRPQRVPKEDCFCCCSHIVSSPFASSLDALAVVSSADPVLSPDVRPASIRHLFRPPRVA